MLAIDVREACRPVRTGKAQWTSGFVAELVRRGAPLILFSDSPLPSEWSSASNVRPVVTSVAGPLWHLATASALRRMGNVLYVSPTSFIVPSLVGRSVHCIPIVHDLIAYRDEPHDRKARWVERLTLARALKNSEHICTVSEATKRDLLARFPGLDPARITTIYAGPMRENPPVNRPDGRTILCVATLCPRKNQERLILAYRSLPSPLFDRYRLLLVGSRGWNDDAIIRLARSTLGVEWRDYVPDAEYERLLSTCTIFALPSLYEGFGMQVLDALQRGIPVLTSDRGSLREVAGEAAVYANPQSVASIAQRLEELLTDGGWRKQLAEHGPQQAEKFSWERTVDAFMERTEGISR